MQETLKVRQANLDALHAAHRTLQRDSEALDASVPPDVAAKLQQLDADWGDIQRLMLAVRSLQQQQPPSPGAVLHEDTVPVAGKLTSRVVHFTRTQCPSQVS